VSRPSAGLPSTALPSTTLRAGRAGRAGREGSSASLAPGPLALVETASAQGVEARRRVLREQGAFDLGWSYANILDAAPRLSRQLAERGYFRLYLYLPGPEGGEGEVRCALRVAELAAFTRPESHTDPVDGRRYLVHSRMTVTAIEDIFPPRRLSSFASADGRHMDPRHLELGFLFVSDEGA
jgi:hypothetical protein